MKIATLFMHVKFFFTRKRVIWGVVILFIAFLGWFFFIRKSINTSVQTAVVAIKDIKKTVLTTGQVVSSTDLDLSFQSSGVVKKINVKEGDQVTSGTVLAVLDQSSQSAALESARGALTQAKANFEKTKAGATLEDVAVSRAAVDSAKVTLDNARLTLSNQITKTYNDVNTQIITATNILFTNPQSNFPQFGIAGTLQTNQQAVIQINAERVEINNLLLDWQMQVSNLKSDNLDSITSLSLSNLQRVSNFLSNIISLLNTYTQVTASGSQTTLTTYTTGVSTAKTTIDTAYTTLSTYNQSVKSAAYSLAQSEASLQLKLTGARPEDVSIAEAQVQSAQGQYNQALANFNNTMIVAPAKGTITQVNIKLGEQATAMSPVIKLLDVGNLYTEAQVSEADIASVKVGQIIDNTFDALGPDRHFESKVLTVNPAATLVSGVVNYKVTGSLENIPEVKPGMTSNMTILVAERKGVMVAPSSAVISHNGQKFVRVINDPKSKTYNEVSVQVGLEADGGDIEIISGLLQDQEVVTFVK